MLVFRWLSDCCCSFWVFLCPLFFSWILPFFLWFISVLLLYLLLVFCFFLRSSASEKLVFDFFSKAIRLIAIFGLTRSVAHSWTTIVFDIGFMIMSCGLVPLFLLMTYACYSCSVRYLVVFLPALFGFRLYDPQLYLLDHYVLSWSLSALLWPVPLYFWALEVLLLCYFFNPL